MAYSYDRRAETVIRQVGTCGFCERSIKSPENRLAVHGYKRPGVGFIQGECPGSGKPPLELSPVTAEMARDFYERKKTFFEGLLRDLPNATELPDPFRGSLVQRKVQKNSVEPYIWDRAVEYAESDWKRALEAVGSLHAHFSDVVKSWKVTTVKQVSEESVQQERKERQDNALNKKWDKYKTLKTKVLERLDRSFSNLKQRETKYKTKPTEKLAQDMAAAANIIYEMYEGALYNLWYANPNVALYGSKTFSYADFLKELDRDVLLTHLGLKTSGGYVSREVAKELGRKAYSIKFGWDSAKGWKPFWPGYDD